MKAIIKRIYDGGLIVDVDGKEGRVPRRELDWKDPYFNPIGNFKENDTIDVVPYETPEADRIQFSLRRAIYDPWESHHEKYQIAIRKGKPLVARGVVTDVTPKCVYLMLEDSNDALFLWENVFSEEEEMSKIKEPVFAQKKDLTEWFSVGDHVEGIIKGIRTDQKTLVLDIAHRREKLAVQYCKEHEEIVHWAGTIGALHPQLAALGFVQISQQKSSYAFSDLKVLGVEDNDSDRDDLKTFLTEIGCNFDLPKTYEEFVSILEKSNSFDCIILDKNLDKWKPELKGYDLLPMMRSYQPTAPIAAFSQESHDRIEEQFQDPNISTYEKPYKKELIEDFFERSTGRVKTSSLKTLKTIDESFKNVRDFFAADISFEDHLRTVLKILCNMDIENLRAAILRMDDVGGEVELISSYGLEDIPWSTYKSTLRHTPVSDIILGNQNVLFSIIPERRKKNFPKEIAFVSFAGLPVETFGSTRYGLFIFGRSDETITEAIYALAHELAFALARILERKLIDDILASEAFFASMGRLYSSMGHEIRGAVTGIKEAPEDIRNSLRDIKKYTSDPIEFEKKIADIHKSINAVDVAGKNILKLFDSYVDLTRNNVLIEPINVKELVDGIVDEIKREIQKVISCKVNFKLEIKGDVIIHSSRVKLRQILRNLILNACQQMEVVSSAFPRVYVEASIEAEMESIFLKIKVEDNGPGIHRKDWERIFEPLYSTRRKGAGFGLYLSRILAYSMKGKIRVEESYMFIGTTFSLTVPVE